MFSSSAPNPLDLRWRMFGIAVRIKLTFWLVWLLLGWFAEFRVERLIPWILVILVSFFIHELAHVIVGRCFGVRGGIVIGAFGGAPTGNYAVLRRWQRILVYAAGPAASFGLWALAGAYRTHGNPNAIAGNAGIIIWRIILQVQDLNYFWACINLLPIYPLDGGMIVRDLCESVSRRYGLILSLIISFAVAAGLGAYSAYAYFHPNVWHWGWPLLSLIFDAMLAFESLTLLVGAIRERRPPPEPTEAPTADTQRAPEEYVHDWDKRDRRGEQSRTFP